MSTLNFTTTIPRTTVWTDSSFHQVTYLQPPGLGRALALQQTPGTWLVEQACTQPVLPQGN